MKNKYYTWGAIIICALFLLVGFLSVQGDALTSDEVSHIPAGYYYLTTGRYFINPEHPPLTKDLAALPLLFLDMNEPEIKGVYGEPEILGEQPYPYSEDTYLETTDEVHNGQWYWGRMLLFFPGNDPDQITFWARLSVIFFNSLLLFFLFYSLKKAWNARAAILGLFLIAASPFSLGHASLVTLDFMPALLQMIAFCWLAIFMKKWIAGEKYWGSWTLAMVFFSGAMLSKFSFAMFIVAGFLAGFGAVLFMKRTGRDIWGFTWRYALLGVGVAIIIGIFYAPHVMNMPAEELAIQVQNTYPEEGLPAIGEEVMTGLAKTNFVIFKAWAEYGVGVTMVLSRIASAWQTIYFLGGVYGSEGAGLLYFPVLFATKLTIPFLALLGLSLVLAGIDIFTHDTKIKAQLKNYLKNPLAFFFVFAILLYAAITAFSSFQIGLRHIMPIILASAILTGKELSNWWDKKWIQYATGAAAVLMIGSLIIAFPHYLEYYNLFAGGTKNGYKISTDSNYDWAGQDLKRVAKWMQENGVEEIYADVFTNVPLKYYLGDKEHNYNIVWDWDPPPGSYVVVSANNLQNNIYNKDIPEEDKYSQWDDYLIDRVGETMFIYRIGQ